MEWHRRHSQAKDEQKAGRLEEARVVVDEERTDFPGTTTSDGESRRCRNWIPAGVADDVKRVLFQRFCVEPQERQRHH